MWAAPARGDDEEPPPSAWEEAFASTSVSYEFVLRYWRIRPKSILTGEVTNEDYYDTVHRAFVTSSHGALTFGLQLDGVAALPRDKAALFADDAPPHAFETGAFIPEKIFARFTPDDEVFEVGDYYKSLGRGMALSLIRNVDVDTDTSLRGAAAELGLGAVRAQAFAGVTNPQTVSLNFRNELDADIHDRIAGVGAESDVGPATVGAHIVHYDYDPKAESNQTELEHESLVVRRAAAFGALASIPDIRGLLDAYVEATGVRYVTRSPFTDRTRLVNGHGVYGSMTGYFGPVSVQVEGKSYVEMEGVNLRAGLLRNPYEYVTPPTLEKENVVTNNSSKAVNSSNISGGRATVGYTRGSLTYKASYAFFQDLGHITGATNLNEWIHHGWVAAELRKNGSFVQLTAGARLEPRIHEPDVADRVLHVDADALLPLGGNRTLESKVLVYRSEVWDPVENPGNQQIIDNRELTVSFRPWTWSGITVYWDYTTDPTAAGFQGARNGNVAENHYVAGEIDVRPDPSSTIRLFVGAQKGGLKCSGGTCRVLPPFEGVRLEGAFRF